MEIIFYILLGLLIFQGIAISIFSISLFFLNTEKKYKQYISKSYGNDYYKELGKIVDSEVLAKLLKKG